MTKGQCSLLLASRLHDRSSTEAKGLQGRPMPHVRGQKKPESNVPVSLMQAPCLLGLQKNTPAPDRGAVYSLTAEAASSVEALVLSLAVIEARAPEFKVAFWIDLQIVWSKRPLYSMRAQPGFVYPPVQLMLSSRSNDERKPNSAGASGKHRMAASKERCLPSDPPLDKRLGTRGARGPHYKRRQQILVASYDHAWAQVLHKEATASLPSAPGAFGLCTLRTLGCAKSVDVRVWDGSQRRVR